MSDAHPTTRRDFLRALAGTGAGLGLAASVPAGLDGHGPGTAAAAPADPDAAGLLPVVPRRPLGSTGQTVPILLMGCAQRFDPRYDKLLHRAFKEGVDYLDTATSYAGGQSHRTIAPFLRQIGDRKKLWITSKGSPWPQVVEGYESQLDLCLEQLETDYLDLYFMHGIDDVGLLEREYLAMGERMRKSGRTRFFGFSCHGGRVVELMNRAAEAGGVDVIMFRYSFRSYGDLKLNQAIDRCKKAGIGLIAMKTMDSVPKGHEDVVKFQSKNFTLPQAKLKAVWSDARIDAAVSEMTNTAQLAENVTAAKSPVELSMAEFQQLQLLARATAPYACRGCAQTCETQLDAPVKVADSLRFLMYHDSYGETERARTLYRALAPEQRAFDGLDFTRAAAACPQGIDIASRLREARSLLGEELA